MGLFAQTEFATLAALALLGLTIGFLLLRSHRYLARQDRSQSPIVHTARPESCQRAAHLGAPDEVTQWELELHETARDLCGQLDSKMSALGHLVREADRAAARLEAALEARQRSVQPSVAEGATPHAPDSSKQSVRLPPQPTNQAEALQSAGGGNRVMGRAVGEEDAGQQRSGKGRYEEIYLLADYGFDALEIARRTGTPVGEIELILGLRHKRQSPGAARDPHAAEPSGT